MCAGLKNEQTLGEQVAEIRESKAIIRERLQATEVALAEARQHSHGLQQKVQFLQQRISDLEVETATLRSQPTENLLTALRQKELEDKNTQLLADIVKAHEDAKEAAEVFAGQAQFLAEREEQIKCLNAQAEELGANLTALHEEKTASEQRAAARCDEVRDQVLAAANTEKRKILNAHANTLHQLKCQKIQKDEAEFRVEELSSQLVALKNAEGNKARSFLIIFAGLTRLTVIRTKLLVISGPTVPTWRSGAQRKSHMSLLCKRRFVESPKSLNPTMRNSQFFERLRLA